MSNNAMKSLNKAKKTLKFYVKYELESRVKNGTNIRREKDARYT